MKCIAMKDYNYNIDVSSNQEQENMPPLPSLFSVTLSRLSVDEVIWMLLREKTLVLALESNYMIRSQSGEYRID